MFEQGVFEVGFGSIGVLFCSCSACSWFLFNAYFYLTMLEGFGRGWTL